MPGIRRILPLAVSSILMSQALHAAPKWDCRASSSGEWICYEDGSQIPAMEPARALAEQPAGSTPESSSTPAETADTKPVEVQAVPEPAPAVAAPLVEKQSQEKEGVAETAQPKAEDKAPETAARTAPNTAEKASTPAPVSSADEERKESSQPTPSERTADQQPAQGTLEPETQQAAEETPVEQPIVAAEPADKDTEIATTHSTPIDQGLDWSQCYPSPLLANGPGPFTSDDSTQISADGADLHRNENIAYFTGNVEIESGEQHILADKAEYDRGQGTVSAQGNVLYEQSNLRFTSNNLHYDTNTEQGSAGMVEYRLLDRAARGTAETAEVNGEYLTSFTGVTYTTCKPGNTDWILRAAELNLDKESGVGVAKNASVSFKGVPFFYTPYISFPIDDRRKSGFLVPTIGTSENTGLDVTAPYYFNIAPNMDATLSPRLMSKRGLMLGGEYRYLTQRHSGEVNAELLMNDREQAPGELDDRGALSLKLRGAPADRWNYDIDINHVSDDDYLEDFGNSLAATSERHQERRADLNYQGEGWHFVARAQDFQTTDKNIAAIDEPYNRLPQLLAALERPNEAYGLTYHLRAEYVKFDHGEDTKVRGERINLKPGISLPMRRSWGFLTPKLSIDYTTYDLENQGAGLDDSPSRTLPTFSLDGGLIFERELNLFDTALTQTLEPRLYYLYTPKEDQSDIPDFDTSDLDFSFGNLFRENRFSGVDKIGDANQLTTAVTSRFLDRNSGREYGRASLGQIFYFRDREVQLQSTGATINDDTSAIVAAISANLTNDWRADAGIIWNPHTNDGETEQGSLGLHYNDDHERIFNATYRFTRNSIEQTDLSARWPVAHNLHLVGRWNYSMLHDQTMEAFAGIEYDNCCWVTRFVAREYRSGTEAQSNLGFFIQLELKGLTSLGDKIDEFLEKGILGYTTKN